MKFHWFLPTNGGDGRQVVSGGHGVAHGNGGRPASVPYLGQIARSAEQLGFEAALTPTGAWCEDAWLSTAMLAPLSERLKFLVAFRPGLTSPTLAAQMAATFQNLSGGRLLLNVVTGGESHEQRAYGDFLDKDERYQRCDEFLEIVRRLWTRRAGDLRRRATCASSRRSCSSCPTRSPRSTSAAPRPPPATSPPSTPTSTSPGASRRRPWRRRSPGSASSPRSRAARSASASAMHTINRDTSEEAWAEADRLLEGIDDAEIQRVQEGLKRSESVGQQNMLALNNGSRDGLEIHPNVWAGVGLVRGGAGTALVGSHEEVADRIEEYAALGIDEFVLSAYPHLEGAYHFGEGVLPVLEKRGLWTNPAPVAASASVPFGGQRAGVMSARVAVVVGNPKPRSRTYESALTLADAARRRRPGRRPGRPRRRELFDWTLRRPSTSLVEQVGRQPRGHRRQPDLQGDLHRPAQGVPRPVPRTRGSAGSPRSR